MILIGLTMSILRSTSINITNGDNKMKIEYFKGITIAYRRAIGEYGIKNYKFMESFKRYLEENYLMNDRVTILGIALDNPEVIPADELRYDVGIISNNLDKVINLSTRNIDDGEYAIFEVSHTESAIKKFWKSIYDLDNRISIDYNKLIIERYKIEKIKNNLCEFCVPILEK